MTAFERLHKGQIRKGYPDALQENAQYFPIVAVYLQTVIFDYCFILHGESATITSDIVCYTRFNLNITYHKSILSKKG